VGLPVLGSAVLPLCDYIVANRGRFVNTFFKTFEVLFFKSFIAEEFDEFVEFFNGCAINGDPIDFAALLAVGDEEDAV
jgi:hypothetical protein